MRKFLKLFIVKVAEYIAPIITIIIGIYIGLTYNQHSTEEILSYIITLLTLIAGTLLIEKLMQLSSIDKRTKRIEKKIIDSDIFMYCNTSEFWHDAMNSAKSLFISGGSLFHVISEKPGDFQTLLKRGCQIEVVVMDPFSMASDLLYNNVVKEVQNTKRFSNNIIQTLELLFEFQKEYPKQLTIRLNNHVPSFGIFAIYKDDEPQKIQVNLFSERVPYDKRLAISLDSSSEKNHLAFEYFCNQINLLKERLPELSITELERIINN